MKVLSGKELADYIEERQAGQVRALRQAMRVVPKLAIVAVGESAVSDGYIRLKQNYAEEILIEVSVLRPTMEQVGLTIEQLNADPLVHGIIVQLPLPDPTLTDNILAMIAPEKDVDGLGPNAAYTSATATAIDWLLAGYNVELRGKRIGIVGQGRLVGAPLAKLWATTGLDVSVFDDTTTDLTAALRSMEVIVSGAGVPGLITEHMVQPGAVVVDAGTTSEDGKIVGDVAPSLRERQDVTMTPEKGGVGPLTITALFENLIKAAGLAAEATPGEARL